MQSHSSPPPPFRRPAKSHVAGPTQDGPRPAERNEFSDALSRMFEHRQRLAPDFAPGLREDSRLRDDADEWDTPRTSLLGSLVGAPAVRRALSIVPLAIIGYAIAWFLYFEPSQDVTAKPFVEAKPEVMRSAAPSEPAPPARPQVAETTTAPASAATTPAATTPAATTPAATTPAAPSPPPAVAAALPSQPLSKDEIKELQSKLGAAGFAAGPIDGVIGPQTQAALRRYAQSRNLAKPEATQETLLRLRSETQASQ